MKFDRNPQFEAQLRREPAFRAALSDAADAVKDAVEEAAPRGDDDDYAESIETFVDGETVGVASTDIAAHLVEWGSKNNPPYAPLRRGAQAAGLRLEETSK